MADCAPVYPLFQVNYKFSSKSPNIKYYKTPLLISLFARTESFLKSFLKKNLPFVILNKKKIYKYLYLFLQNLFMESNSA